MNWVRLTQNRFSALAVLRGQLQHHLSLVPSSPVSHDRSPAIARTLHGLLFLHINVYMMQPRVALTLTVCTALHTPSKRLCLNTIKSISRPAPALRYRVWIHITYEYPRITSVKILMEQNRDVRPGHLDIPPKNDSQSTERRFLHDIHCSKPLFSTQSNKMMFLFLT